jgi:hypothetical protein
MRLWGDHKTLRGYQQWVSNGSLGAPRRRTHRGRDNAPSNWEKATNVSEDIEVGDIHWAAPPAITRMQEMLWVHRGVKSESASIQRSGKINQKVARTVMNVFYHIGQTRTPNFKR